MVNSDQIRAARVILGWSQSKVAQAAGISVPTLKRAESGGTIRVSDKANAAIRSALEAGGVVFIPANGGGAGVRRRDR